LAAEIAAEPRPRFEFWRQVVLSQTTMTETGGLPRSLYRCSVVFPHLRMLVHVQNLDRNQMNVKMKVTMIRHWWSKPRRQIEWTAW